MANGLLDKRNDYLSINDYISAYDDGIAFDEVEVISTPFIKYVSSDFFKQFKKLKYVNLPNLRSLPSEAFSNCSTVETIILPKVSEINSPYMFFNCYELKEAIFSSEIKVGWNGYLAFGNCYNLSSLQAIKCNGDIPERLFWHCSKLKSIIIKKDYANLTIYSSAFEGCSELSQFIAECSTVNQIYSNAFNGCNKLFSIGSNIQLSRIHDGAFKQCNSLKGINELISSVSYIGKSAFEACFSLYSLKINGNITIESNAFYLCQNLSKIDASELNILRGLPYVKNHDFRNINTINEVLINPYLDPILDLSTVTTVNTGSKGLSIFEVIKLDNCTSFNFTSYNIDGRKTREFILPKYPVFRFSSISVGFGGFKVTSGSTTYEQFYSNIVTSKIIAPNIEFFNSYNFPLNSTRVFPNSNLLLYSCIEELHMRNFYSFESNVSYFSKLKTLYTSEFFPVANMSTLMNVYLENVSHISGDVRCSIIDTEDPLYIGSNRAISLYFRNTSYAYFTYENIYEFSDIDFKLHFENVSGAIEINYPLYNTMSMGLSELFVSNVSIIDGYDMTFYHKEHPIDIDMNGIREIAGTTIYNTSYSENFGLNNLYMNDVISVNDLRIYGNEHKYINNLHLNGLSTISSTYALYLSYINNVYIGVDELHISMAHGRYNCSIDNISRLYMNNCSIIETFPYILNASEIYASKCNHINIHVSDSSDSSFNSVISKLRLSEYVDYFKIQNCNNLNEINFKTSSSYILSDGELFRCYVSNIYLTASGDIYISPEVFKIRHEIVGGYGISSSYNTLSLTAFNDLKIYDFISERFQFTHYELPYNNLLLSCPNGLLTISGFEVKNVVSIYAKSIDFKTLNIVDDLLMILDTSNVLSSNPFYFSSHTYSYNAIIKVRQSLLSYYTESSYWQQFSSYLQFLPI